ncbi:hypothetical protein PMI27_003617 [Pseudomonas sp. GM41(2012)]|uniref:SoxR reducing system RseC family protein n=1 Tax=Pseudomonas sp. (strain GM41(2012)) TaxID=1144708 RepID=UPI00027032BB|nr:SoxR reducing system RseC family protein [Pseudomonas sp. GM41(2012)]EUB73874.1 hypothetical protein PMI27_003617 [Pseudomonas sp. GM41(2012)]
MPNKIDIPMPAPQLEQSRSAGDVEPFPSGKITYLAPLPLPTALPPHGPHIGDLNEVFMDFGLGSPQVFSWQVVLGLPFSGTFMIAFLFPLIGGFLGLVLGYSWEDTRDSIEGIFHASYGLALITGFSALAILFFTWLHYHNKRAAIIPTRFNRQRREVCFMPEDTTEPVFVPWESLSAWVIEAQGATQYGIHRQYGMGIGFQHGETLTSVEFPCFGLSLAISHWEAIAATWNTKSTTSNPSKPRKTCKAPTIRPTKACTPSTTPAHACISKSATANVVECPASSGTSTTS